MSVTVSGARDLEVRLESFPEKVHRRLEEVIGRLTGEIESQAQELAPVGPPTPGRLRSEIMPRLFADVPTRVAGYVSVYATDPKEYPKAGALEYGIDGMRKLAERASLSERRIAARIASVPVHMRAFRYLRGALDEYRGEAEEAIAEALAEAAGES